MNLKKTKTYKYLFEPSIYMYYTSEIKDILFSFNIINVYLGDKSVDHSEMTDGIFYILVKVDSNFENKINNLKQTTKYYLGSYVVGDKQDNLAIIMFKSMTGKCLENFIQSKYSGMYSSHLLDSDKDKFIVYNTVTKKIELSNVYHILKHSKEYHENLVQQLAIDDELAKEVWDKEFDSKINPDEEMFNINLLYQPSYGE